MAARDFQPTMAMNGNDRHRQNALPQPGEHKLGQSPSEDSSWIIIGVLAVMCLIGALPQFEWFQDLTAITSWMQFLRNLLGTGDLVQLTKNLLGWL